MFDTNNIQIEASEDITDSEIEELRLLYATPVGTIPMDRSKGIDMSFLSMSGDVAKNLYSVEIIKKTRLYANNIEVSSITYNEDDDGKIKAKVVIYRGE